MEVVSTLPKKCLFNLMLICSVIQAPWRKSMDRAGLNISPEVALHNHLWDFLKWRSDYGYFLKVLPNTTFKSGFWFPPCGVTFTTWRTQMRFPGGIPVSYVSLVHYENSVCPLWHTLCKILECQSKQSLLTLLCLIWKKSGSRDMIYWALHILFPALSRYFPHAFYWSLEARACSSLCLCSCLPQCL